MTASHGITSEVLEYRFVPGYPRYQVSNRGDVLSLRIDGSWQPLKPGARQSGHLAVGLRANNQGRTFLVHRLVLTIFVEPCPLGMECRHLNGKSADNRVENLQWGTRNENIDDMRRHGVLKGSFTGERHFNAKLTDETAAEALVMHQNGAVLRDIACRLNVSHVAIWQVVHGITFKNLPRKTGV